MLLLFSCENCGKRFQVDESAQEARAVQKLRPRDEDSPPGRPKPGKLTWPGRRESTRPGRRFISARPSHRPRVTTRLRRPIRASPVTAGRRARHRVRVVVDQAELDAATPLLPRNCEGFARSKSSRKTPADTTLWASAADVSLSSAAEVTCPRAGFMFSGGPTSVTGILKILRFIDSWAYLISAPFLVMVLFAIVTSSRGLVHAGAVVVVVVNYGRFWADLIALFVRPFKDGPIQGLAFLFPPYTVYYLFAHWDSMKPILPRMLTSCIPIVLVIMAYRYLPSINPEVHDVQDVRAGSRSEPSAEERYPRRTQANRRRVVRQR